MKRETLTLYHLSVHPSDQQVLYSQASSNHSVLHPAVIAPALAPAPVVPAAPAAVAVDLAEAETDQDAADFATDSAHTMVVVMVVVEVNSFLPVPYLADAEDAVAVVRFLHLPPAAAVDAKVTQIHLDLQARPVGPTDAVEDDVSDVQNQG